MIKYEDYALPKCTLLSSGGSNEPLAFFRSEFEYAPRQRSTYRGKVTAGFGLVLEHYELATFESFYAAINYGADAFLADFMVHGSANYDKTIRFTAPYSIKPLGKFLYQITAAIEVLAPGTPEGLNCPILPSNTLYPSTTLYTC